MKKSFILIALYFLLISGWVLGLVRFCKCDFEPSYKAEVIYGLGIVTGLNSILGWIDFGK
jgi:hypothetical protein